MNSPPAPHLGYIAFNMTRFRFSLPFRGRGGLPPLPVFDLENNRADIGRELRELLLGNLLPFWTDHILDRARGGYALPGNAAVMSPEGKMNNNCFLVYQARTLWFFSHLADSPFGDPNHLEIARHGYDFLVNQMWDLDEGGFFWKLDSHSGRPLIESKHLYGQAFALFALSRYARASGDKSAAEFAEKLLVLIEGTQDRTDGGFNESVDRFWKPLPADELSVIGLPAHAKSLNTHLHLFEAFSSSHRMQPTAPKRKQVDELIDILVNRTILNPSGACTDQFTSDWMPISIRGELRVSYGHVLEFAWLLLTAMKFSPALREDLLSIATALSSHALEYGFDWERGGIFESGRLGKKADRRNKIWWVQAEGILALLHLHIATGESRFARAFSSTLSWVSGKQVDREGGEWHHRLDARDRPGGCKAGEWKSPYHTGRALLDCIDLLDKMEDSATPVDGGTGR